jgi:hypothetical protein
VDVKETVVVTGQGVQNVQKVPLRNFSYFNDISFENPDIPL